MIFIFNKRGTTLVETLLAFSVFITCTMMILSFYLTGHKNLIRSQDQYNQYYLEQNERENELWNNGSLEDRIRKVLP